MPKDEKRGYKPVKSLLAEMRLDGKIPLEWIVDNTRAVQDPSGYGSVAEFLDTVPWFYRSDFWSDEPVDVSLWLEKDGLPACSRR